MITIIAWRGASLGRPAGWIRLLAGLFACLRFHHPEHPMLVPARLLATVSSPSWRCNGLSHTWILSCITSRLHVDYRMVLGTGTAGIGNAAQKRSTLSFKSLSVNRPQADQGNVGRRCRMAKIKGVTSIQSGSFLPSLATPKFNDSKLVYHKAVGRQSGKHPSIS